MDGGSDLNQKSLANKLACSSPLLRIRSLGDLVHSLDTSMTSFDVVSSSVRVESFLTSWGSKRLKKPHFFLGNV